MNRSPAVWTGAGDFPLVKADDGDVAVVMRRHAVDRVRGGCCCNIHPTHFARGIGLPGAARGTAALARSPPPRRYSPSVSSEALPPAAVVLMLTTRSVMKRCR